MGYIQPEWPFITVSLFVPIHSCWAKWVGCCWMARPWTMWTTWTRSTKSPTRRLRWNHGTIAFSTWDHWKLGEKSLTGLLQSNFAPEQQCPQTNVVYFCRAERGYKPHHLAVVSNVFTFRFSAWWSPMSLIFPHLLPGGQYFVRVSSPSSFSPLHLFSLPPLCLFMSTSNHCTQPYICIYILVWIIRLAGPHAYLYTYLFNCQRKCPPPSMCISISAQRSFHVCIYIHM